MKKQATERLSNSLQDRRLIIDEAVLEGMAPAESLKQKEKKKRERQKGPKLKKRFVH